LEHQDEFEPVANCDRIILDSDLARIFGVEIFDFNKVIKRNRNRFPGDFN